MRRGNHAEIDIFPGQPVDNPLAGNVVDLCPVGALLDKDFLHKQRAWFLSKHDSDLHALLDRLQHQRRGEPRQLWRFKPRHNPLVNDYWICDEGRYSYKAANDPSLLAAMYVRKDGDLRAGSDRRGRSKPSWPGLSEIAETGGDRRRGALAVPDGRGSLPAGLVPEGAEPANVLALGRCRRRERPDLHARPDQGPDRRHQLRRPAAVHDPRREVPEPAGRRGASSSTSRAR